MPGHAGHSPWGWHRLAPSWAERLVADAGVSRGELVLDIGAGTGALTAALAERGARVVAFELHPQRLAALRSRFAGHNRVTVVRADVADLRLPRQPFRVVASPPFAQTTAVLSRLLAPGSRLMRADLVVQQQAAQRWAAGRAPGAGRWAQVWDARAAQRLPRHAFDPPPRCDCAVLRLTRSTGRR
ncbi:MAG TPA: rRNA adenine N-6-methyltransferase family protein [Acidimicrobiales bacterium]|nr:rRNA adenine N-6-methyltransferase family protein [Acidimicrobiales bacterium]